MSSGCCPQGDQECSPVKVNCLNLTFGVTNKRGISYIQVKAQNHTECACQNVRNRKLSTDVICH